MCGRFTQNYNDGERGVRVGVAEEQAVVGDLRQ
jgi:hypothetical protein